ncbi:hypothetical protein [Pseudarthrobacter sp. NamB4]|uniref:hypothetical protein n=1 Tax=Pseudarthrobacter sp. NamB4 TaxID=2576837 RepID=UPI0010FEEEB3|nr:hypothetical protein [Pseudarthrobacter sp. NamB4]TLM73579.1 hypothetical protein FDW81_09025 [Pseudarthrobacter sp. NamB4]
MTVVAADPFGVLVRNNTELCFAGAADAVAGFALGSHLEVGGEGRSAVVRLTVAPKPKAAGPAQAFTIATVNGREGQLKIAAGDVLRAQLYDFVTKTCNVEQ